VTPSDLRIRTLGSQRPRRRWLLATLIAGAVTLLAVELLSVLIYPQISHAPYSRSRLQKSLAERASAAPQPDAGAAIGESGFIPEHVLHPYAGFSYNPSADPEINAFGFYGESPVVERDPSRVNAVLLGGSVAREFYQLAGERLATLLAEIPRYRGREIHLVCLAVDGFKQPQSLLALTFALYLGAEYDVVVNLDGFNEVVLPITDNLPNRVFPHYPRAWNLYADKGLSPTRIALAAELMSIRERQHASSRRFSNPLLRSSNFALIVWENLDRRYELEAQRAYFALLDRARLGNPDTPHGPAPDPTQPPRETSRDAADRWAQASLQMRDLAEANGARYFHFLQPNQYVAGSKVFTEEEKRFADVDAYRGRHFPYHPSVRNYKPAAQMGYPLLIERGAALRQRGVNFVDLTGIFADVRETIYRDACCHYNQTGNEIIAERMAREIARVDAEVVSPPR
jgi:hypothetical protein